jgi:hypothetical protein
MIIVHVNSTRLLSQYLLTKCTYWMSCRIAWVVAIPRDQLLITAIDQELARADWVAQTHTSVKAAPMMLQSYYLKLVHFLFMAS